MTARAAVLEPPPQPSVRMRTVSGFTEASVPDAARLLEADPSIVVLDVRTKVEHAAGRIAEGLNLDFFADDFGAQLAGLDRSGAYLLYCRSGGRSALALELMRELGFRSVVHMPEGFDGWVGARRPVQV